MLLMKAYKNLWEDLCSYENLELAFLKARKGKTQKPYVIEFEKNLKENLLQLRAELLLHAYRPKPLATFIIRDPKTRKISKSDFRDRIIHHAIVNILEPIFEKSFIYDSYANRKNKGTLKAIQRFDCFKRKVSKNNTRVCFILKADIEHYFETVDHNILIGTLKRKIKDNKVIWLIKQILNNFNTKIKGKGMPLGNLTSQFLANVYLNELDYFIKHKLKAKYYIRYVDDFVLFNNSCSVLKNYKRQINLFLKERLNLELHQDKSKIKKLSSGISFLGFRIFYYHKLLKKVNINRMKNKINKFDEEQLDYDVLYLSFEGWITYAKHANTFNLRTKLINLFEKTFPYHVATIQVNRLIKTGAIEILSNEFISKTFKTISFY